MSVSDPLLKELKGCVQQFLQISSNNEPITDNNFYLIHCCQTIEKIFEKGQIREQHTKYFNRIIDSYAWMISVCKCKNANFQYLDCVEKTRNRKNIFTNDGRFRLLIKYCLWKKCLHVPVELLKESQTYSIFYSNYSILGDEILSEIFLSVLLQLGKLNFELDLNNSAFLDDSWYIPEMVIMELVPSKILGVSVSFAGEKAVIVNIQSNSIIGESGIVKTGDVMEKLNEIHICSAVQGRLGSILRNTNKCKPITLTILKAYNKQQNEMYGPIEKLLKELHMDIDMIRRQYENQLPKNLAKKYNTGFVVDYLGTVDIGGIGSVKQVQKALKCMLCQSDNHFQFTVKLIGEKVLFEIGEISIKVKSLKTGTVILEHSYMKISSCGNLFNTPCVFGYSAGKENCDIAESFVCFIFETKKIEEAELLLQSLGQGFQRTHYAV